MSDLSRLKKLMKSANGQHGKGTIGLAASNRPLDMPRIPTGSLAFDFATGGGIPVGRTTMFWGKESSGKTTGAMRVGGEAQRLCWNCYRPAQDYEVVQTVEEEIDPDTGEVLVEAEWEARGYCDCYKEGLFKPRPFPDELNKNGDLLTIEIEEEDPETGKTKKKKVKPYEERLARYKENSYEELRVAFIDVEGTFDRKWAQCVGLDDRLLFLINPSTAEEAIDLYNEVLIRSGAIGMIILDSIAAMTPSEEAAASTEDAKVGIHARLMNRAGRIWQAGLNASAKEYGRLVTQIWINQERQKIGVSFGSNKTKPGGMGQNFSPSLEVSMYSSGWQKTNLDGDLIKEHQWEVGTRVMQNILVEKNKTAPAKMKGGYPLFVLGKHKGKVDELKYVMAQAAKYDVYRTDGTGPKKRWYLGNEEFTTKKDILERVQDPVIFAGLKRSLLKVMLKNVDDMEVAGG